MSVSNTAQDRVIAILKAQHSALVAGDVATLTSLPEALDRAMRSLGASSPDLPGLATIRTMAARNAALVQAARRGVAQARSQVTGTADAPLTTYDRNGQRRSDPSGRSRVLTRR